MELVHEPKNHGPVSKVMSVLQGTESSLEVKTKYLIACTTLAPSIETGNSLMPVRQTARELIQLKKCLEAHHTVQYSTNELTVERAHIILGKNSKTRDSIMSLLNSANYLGHDALVSWCYKRWSQKRYMLDETITLPYELETRIAGTIIQSTGLFDIVPRCVASEQWLRPRDLPSYGFGSIWSMAINKTGTHVAVGDDYGLAHVHDIQGIDRTISLDCHERPISTISFGNNKATIITSAEDGSIKLWDVASGDCIKALTMADDESPFIFKSNHAGTHCAFNEQERVIMLDLIKNKRVELTGHSCTVIDIVFTRDDTLFATCCSQNVFIWDAATQELKGGIETGKPTTSLAFSPDASLLAVGTNAEVFVYDVRTHALRYTLENHSDTIWGLYFSQDNQFLFSASKDTTLKIWHVPSTSLLKSLSHYDESLNTMCIHENKLLLTGSEEGHITVWDIEKLLKPIQSLQRKLNYSCSLAQADLISRACNSYATNSTGLNCNTDTQLAAVFKELDPAIQAFLIQHLKVKASLKIKRGRKGSQYTNTPKNKR